jgi:hypothetical protein
MEGRIRPWYRSRLFWLGVPGLVFLMWGWWKSGSQMVRFSNGINDSNPAVGLFFDESCLMISWELDWDFDWHIELEEAGMFEQTSDHPVGWFSKRFGYELEELGSRQLNQFYIPLWLAVASYSVLWWGALLLWRRFQTKWHRVHQVENPGLE